MTSPGEGGSGTEFRLYVAGESPNSRQAVVNFKFFADRYLMPYVLEVVDAMEYPQRAIDDGVVVTPTLLRLGAPVVRVVGNLSDTAALLASLGGAGVVSSKRVDARVQRLVSRLLAAETALEGLISGEADAILGETGEPLLLRDAQHAMRGSVAHYRVLAHHDSLTGVANRLLFASHLKHAIERSRRQHARVALLYLDVDRFKQINDTYGHSVGDGMLRAFSQRVRSSIRSADTIARMGGDEFAVLLEDVEDKSFAERVANKIQGVMGEPFVVDGHEMSVSTSIGIGLFPDNADDVATLTDVTDAAMYRAKQYGRGGYAFAESS